VAQKNSVIAPLDYVLKVVEKIVTTILVAVKKEPSALTMLTACMGSV